MLSIGNKIFKMIKSNKEQYRPGEKVTLDIATRNKDKNGVSAEVLADHGANIHAKNNLVQKMIERNDKNGLVPMGSNKSGRLVLLDKLKSK
jgi:hypothetical protein